MNKLNQVFCYKSWQRHLFDLLLGTLIGLTIASLFNSTIYQSGGEFIKYAIYSFLISAGLWKGNEAAEHIVSHYFPHDSDPKKTFQYTIGWSVVWTLFFIISMNSIWFPLVEKVSLRHFWSSMGIPIILIQFFITVLISSFISAKEYFKAYLRVLKNEEKLKREAIALQYESLKNQVNPHFLFNSLNALSSLVYQDADLSAKFIKKLSDVYRYILEQRNKELVEVNTELKYVKDYIFLQQIRFGENLQYTAINDFDSDLCVVPNSVQMLVENAIKHNIISQEKPLSIEIYKENKHLVVRNNLQKKKAVKDSGKIGLENIRFRYEYISNEEFIVEETNTHFIVKIPVIKESEIKPASHESDNN